MKKFLSCLMILSLLLAFAACGTAEAAGAAPASAPEEAATQTSEITEELVLSDKTGSVTVTKEGVYHVTGTLTDGQITVDAQDAQVTLLLDGVDITAKGTAAIYVVEADKVKLELAQGSTNTLRSVGEFSAADSIDACIFGKDDITVKGSGSLTVVSEKGHGIVSKDDLKITGGSITVTALNKGLVGKDSVEITGGDITVTAGSDAIQSKNTDDNTKGWVLISGGTLTLSAGDDGIHATSTLTVNGGTMSITGSEGMEATSVEINDGDITISASDDGINATAKVNGIPVAIVINGGRLSITMGPGDTDAIDANGSLTINGGIIDITAQSPFDYDTTGTLNGGTVTVNGTQVTELTNQMMGGRGGFGGFGGGHQGGFEGGQGGFEGGQGGFEGGQGGFGGHQGGFGKRG